MLETPVLIELAVVNLILRSQNGRGTALVVSFFDLLPASPVPTTIPALTLLAKFDAKQDLWNCAV